MFAWAWKAEPNDVGIGAHSDQDCAAERKLYVAQALDPAATLLLCTISICAAGLPRGFILFAAMGSDGVARFSESVDFSP